MKSMSRSWRGSAGERGAVLIIALLMCVVLAALGAGAITLTSVNTLTTGNYKLVTQAFYAAEAGTEEARGRLRATAGANLIVDPDPASTQWRAYLGNTTQAQNLWPTTTQQYTPQASLQTIVQAGLSYAVEIRHKTTADSPPTAANPPIVRFWGDPDSDGISSQNTINGQNIYVVTSYGSTSTATREVAVEVTRVPPITIPAALYVQQQTTVQGNATFVVGQDLCGTQNVPAVATTLANEDVGSPAKPSVELTGGPNVIGSPSVVYEAKKLNMQELVDQFKASATVVPTPQSGTLTGGNWGAPTGGQQGSSNGHDTTLPTPSSCTTQNIVHFNTQGTQIKLAGGTSGCGILLVEGDLNVEGGFSWYGPIIVTGSVAYAGGGNKLVTGAILSGGSVHADLVGGNANLAFCSTAISNQTDNLPLQILSWKEL